MKTIRQSVFETNSSSSHSVTIATGYDASYPRSRFENEVLTVSRGKFGWDRARYDDFDTKVSHAFTLAAPYKWCSNGKRDEHFVIPKDDKRLKMLKRVLIRELKPKKLIFLDNDGYVDHQSQDLILDIFESEDTLKAYLFNYNSELVTDNDNG